MSKNFRVYEEALRQNVSHDKRNAVIFDMDGTLAHMNGRSPFDDKRSGADMPDFATMMVLNGIAKAYPGVHILIVSGRKAGSKKETITFLEDYHIPFDDIFMRNNGDYRKDSLVKDDIYRENIEPFYNVLAVFDDRKQVCEKWVGLGLKVFNVTGGVGGDF